MKERIETKEFYQQVLKESYGGVMYNLANLEKYKVEKPREMQELVLLWQRMTEGEKERCGGIMKGALLFLLER